MGQYFREMLYPICGIHLALSELVIIKGHFSQGFAPGYDISPAWRASLWRVGIMNMLLRITIKAERDIYEVIVVQKNTQREQRLLRLALGT